MIENINNCVDALSYMMGGFLMPRKSVKKEELLKEKKSELTNDEKRIYVMAKALSVVAYNEDRVDHLADMLSATYPDLFEVKNEVQWRSVTKFRIPFTRKYLINKSIPIEQFYLICKKIPEKQCGFGSWFLESYDNSVKFNRVVFSYKIDIKS